jgi:hypothetical protein
VQYALLHLATEEPAVLGQQGVPLLQQLLRTRAHSQDPLDALQPWVLLCVLRAVGAAPSDAAAPHALGDAFAQLTVDCASSLLWLGLPSWAVYVLCHLEVRPALHARARLRTLQRVTCRRSCRSQTQTVRPRSRHSCNTL